MVIEKLLECQVCGNEWEGYSMPHFTPRWCPSCKAEKFRQRELEAAKRRNEPDRPRRKVSLKESDKAAESVATVTDREDDGAKISGARVPKPVKVSTPAVHELVCSSCGVTWERPAQRGRKPKVCPSCK